MPRWVCSDDPIPQGHIRLSDAFDLFYEAVTPDWPALDANTATLRISRTGRLPWPLTRETKPAARQK